MQTNPRGTVWSLVEVVMNFILMPTLRARTETYLVVKLLMGFSQRDKSLNGRFPLFIIINKKETNKFKTQNFIMQEPKNKGQSLMENILQWNEEKKALQVMPIF